MVLASKVNTETIGLVNIFCFIEIYCSLTEIPAAFFISVHGAAIQTINPSPINRGIAQFIKEHFYLSLGLEIFATACQANQMIRGEI